jgi:hypothetical protein
VVGDLHLLRFLRLLVSFKRTERHSLPVLVEYDVSIIFDEDTLGESAIKSAEGVLKVCQFVSRCCQSNTRRKTHTRIVVVIILQHFLNMFGHFRLVIERNH